MKVEAWGAQHHVKIHELFEGGFDLRRDDSRDDSPADGSVSIQFITNCPFGINGAYYVRVTLTAEEIDKIYRYSLTPNIEKLKRLIQPAPRNAEKGFNRRY